MAYQTSATIHTASVCGQRLVDEYADAASTHPDIIEASDIFKQLQVYLTQRNTDLVRRQRLVEKEIRDGLEKAQRLTEEEYADLAINIRTMRKQRNTALVRRQRLVEKEIRDGLEMAQRLTEEEYADGASSLPTFAEEKDFAKNIRIMRKALDAAEKAYEQEIADGLSTHPAFIEEMPVDQHDVNERSRKDLSSYFEQLEIETNLRVCAVCSQEKSSREISSKSYHDDDPLFSILCPQGFDAPVLAIPSELRWDWSVSDEENARLQRYRLRVCEQCLGALKKKKLPAESVLSVPLNHFYGHRNGIRELSMSTIGAHKDLFRSLSPTTRSLLSLVRPVFTVITVCSTILQQTLLNSLIRNHLNPYNFALLIHTGGYSIGCAVGKSSR